MWFLALKRYWLWFVVRQDPMIQCIPSHCVFVQQIIVLIVGEACQTSVNQAVAAPPPVLPVVVPTLTNIINCYDDTIDWASSQNITNPSALACLLLRFYISIGSYSYQDCVRYALNHTKVCMTIYYVNSNTSVRAALFEDAYEGILSQGAGYTLMQFRLYESPTSVIWDAFANPNQRQIFCFCTTNYCNADIQTCSSGINYPALFLTETGSTSSTTTSTVSSIIAVTTVPSTVLNRTVANSTRASSAFRSCSSKLNPLCPDLYIGISLLLDSKLTTVGVTMTLIIMTIFYPSQKK